MRHRYLLAAALGLAWSILACAGSASAIDAKTILDEFAADFSNSEADTVDVCIALEVSPPGERWYVLLPSSGGAEVHPTPPVDVAFELSLSATTLRRIYSGELTAFTAAAMASGEEVAPLEFNALEAAGALEDPKGTVLGFLQHFFTRERPERIALGKRHSRIVHGAHVVPLYYASGFRSAWYLVAGGQHLNEPGDTNPFPQAFVVIGGRGTAQIGESKVKVRAGESYFIPPNSDHVLEPAPGDSLEVIWLAWG
ncbi:MAG: hypothetical protein GF355_10005, partial [Candidatus Eisenbacteria bacterium]|nr:hypothetical protein [Candidatus Eisenbacteria bacterium]